MPTTKIPYHRISICYNLYLSNSLAQAPSGPELMSLYICWRKTNVRSNEFHFLGVLGHCHCAIVQDSSPTFARNCRFPNALASATSETATTRATEASTVPESNSSENCSTFYYVKTLSDTQTPTIQNTQKVFLFLFLSGLNSQKIISRRTGQDFSDLGNLDLTLLI